MNKVAADKSAEKGERRASGVTDEAVKKGRRLQRKKAPEKKSKLSSQLSVTQRSC